ncbi:hypothetical protein Sjap_012821 [Stephania japonica]|uniref:DUF4283 domain-containing protein n=1 Tax=Stephania japonica TaxID=461633 RepID=A0AAP0NYN3_9MAGN
MTVVTVAVRGGQRSSQNRPNRVHSIASSRSTINQKKHVLCLSTAITLAWEWDFIGALMTLALHLVNALNDVDTKEVTMEKEIFAAGSAKFKMCLVGKIYGIRSVNRDGFMSTIRRFWNATNGFDVEQVARDYTYVFYFRYDYDRERVLKGGPWSFDNQHLVLIKPEGVGELEAFDFNCSSFWVQIHKVPLVCMTVKVAFFWEIKLGRQKRLTG